MGAVTAHGDLNRMHQFKEKSARQRDLVSADLFTYPVLMAADVLAYRADEVPVGDDQRQHVELMRDVAQRFNDRFGEVLVVPELRIPEVGARIMDLQDPTSKMSTTSGSPEGTVYVLDDAKTVEKKFKRAVTDSDDPPRIARDPSKPGVSNLIDILAAARGASFAEVEASLADARGYGDLKVATADGGQRAAGSGARALHRAAGRRGRAGGDLRRRRRQGARDRRGTRWPTSARRSASARAAESPQNAGSVGEGVGTGRYGLAGMSTLVAELELDLEVFTGPFDLLLTLVLREEVDLLEVELADVVLSYIDVLESRGELDLEVATEFLVLIAALLELKSRLMLPREDEELLDFEPDIAAEELLARMLEAKRYRSAALHLIEKLRWRGRRALPQRAAARAPARDRGRRAGGRLQAGAPGPRHRQHAGDAAARRHPPPDDSARVGRRPPGAPAPAAALGQPHDLRRGGARRRPRDGLRDPVRAAGALQAGRGDVVPGRAVRRDRDPPERG